MCTIFSLFPEHFNGTAYEYSRLALLGTFVNKAGHILVQQATQQSYPSKLAERIAHAVAAADLGRMFSPDGPLIGHTYHQEKTTGASGIPPRIETVLAFQESQSLLLHGNYHYPSDELTQAFTTHRDQVCRYNEKLIKDLESERIENWNELLQRDRDFMRSQS
jgi:hypothetical protein